jgi:hypothetical protein
MTYRFILTGKVLPSEPYAFPVPATSTGDGSTTTVNGTVVTSETALNPDDSRLSGPVEVTRGSGGRIQLWTALDAAVSPNGQAARDAAAWFKIDATRQYVAQQGYVTARNANLLYPAIGAPRSGSPEMVFTITSATINPSAAYTRLGSGRITTVAAGTVRTSASPTRRHSTRPAGVTTPSPSPTPTDTASGWPRNTSRRPPTRTPWTTGEPT